MLQHISEIISGIEIPEPGPVHPDDCGHGLDKWRGSATDGTVTVDVYVFNKRICIRTGEAGDYISGTIDRFWEQLEMFPEDPEYRLAAKVLRG